MVFCESKMERSESEGMRACVRKPKSWDSGGAVKRLVLVSETGRTSPSQAAQSGSALEAQDASFWTAMTSNRGRIESHGTLSDQTFRSLHLQTIVSSSRMQGDIS